MAAPKQPQDRKLKAAEADALKTPFEFEGADGETYTLPPFSPTDAGLTAGDLRKNRKNEVELLYKVLEGQASEEALAATDEFTFERFNEVMQAWQEHSGVDLPKS